MPLSKYPIEIPLGGAVDESSVPEVVQPPRIREAKECASIKGGAYRKRDQEERSETVPGQTYAICHSDDATVCASETEIRVYPDDGTESSTSNPSPNTRFNLRKFEPTEPDAAKEHGDSATLIVNGVPRTLCMWNVDPQGGYEVTAGLTGLDTGAVPPKETQPVIYQPGAPSITAAAGDDKRAWWAYRSTNGVGFAVFEEDRQIGDERSLPTPLRFVPPWELEAGGAQDNEYPQAQGGPCFPRVRGFTRTRDNAQFFVSAAGLATAQQPEWGGPSVYQYFGFDGTDWVSRLPVGARLYTYLDSQAQEVPLNPPTARNPSAEEGGDRKLGRDIMDRNHPLDTQWGYPKTGPSWGRGAATGTQCQRQGPGMVITLHTTAGDVVFQVRGQPGKEILQGAAPYNLEEGYGEDEPSFRPNSAGSTLTPGGTPYSNDTIASPSSCNNNAMLPGPPLDLVARMEGEGDDEHAYLYTLHVDYNQRFQTGGVPALGTEWRNNPWVAPGTGNVDANTTRVMKWRIDPTPPAGEDPIKLVAETYINDPQWTAAWPAGGPPESDPWPSDNWPGVGIGYEHPIPAYSGPLGSYDGLKEWPAALVDAKKSAAAPAADGVIVLFSSTRSVGLRPDLTGIFDPATGNESIGDPFWNPDGLLTGRDSFVRYSTPPTASAPPYENGPTMQMARGVWPGGFAALMDLNGGNWWVGIQRTNEQPDVPQDTPIDEDGWNDGVTDVPCPSGLTGLPCTFHANVVHTRATVQAMGGGPISAPRLVPLGSSTDAPLGTQGMIPGAAIASGGLFVPTIGACVALHACAPGDDRTGVQEIAPDTQSDVLSSSAYLVTNRDLPIPQNADGSLDVSNLDYASSELRGGSNYNVAVAIVQALPFGQALGTFQVNPYQSRVNLRLDSDNAVRWTAAQRFSTLESQGSILIDDPILKTVGSSARAAPYELSFGLDDLLSAQGTAQNGYVTFAGGAMTTLGGPQGLAAGFGLQVVTDCYKGANFVSNPEDPANPDFRLSPAYAVEIPPTKASSVADAGSSSEGDAQAVNVSATLSMYDEEAGEHRSVPLTSSLAFVYAPTDEEKSLFICVTYGVPWELLGVPFSRSLDFKLYFGKAEDGSAPVEVSAGRPPLATMDQPIFAGPLTPTRVPILVGTGTPDQDVYAAVSRSGFIAGTSGTGAALYTWAGELAADAPDPSAGLAAAANRLWSLSAVDRRRVQYTKLLKRGYAPEWNQNLAVRVPAAREELNAIAALPDGRVLLFSLTSVHYIFGEGPSDTGQGAGFSEPAYLTTDIGCIDPASVSVGDYGCIFRGERGFYLVSRDLQVTFIGLPYEDTTSETGGSPKGTVIGNASDALRSEVLFFTDYQPGEDPQPFSPAEVWVFNTLRGQWSTFLLDGPKSVTERGGRPLWLGQYSAINKGLYSFTTDPATVQLTEDEGRGFMSLATGWLPMGRVQGFGRIWEVQLSGETESNAAGTGASVSQIEVEVLYDYEEQAAETYLFDAPNDTPGGGPFKIRFRPRKQKCEAISFRFVERRPSGFPTDDARGWKLDMCTVLAGVKAGLDKVAVTTRRS